MEETPFRKGSGARGIELSILMRNLFILCSAVTLLLIMLERLSCGYVVNKFNLNALFALTIIVGAAAGMVSRFEEDRLAMKSALMLRVAVAAILGTAGYFFLENLTSKALWNMNFLAVAGGALIAYSAFDAASPD